MGAKMQLDNVVNEISRMTLLKSESLFPEFKIVPGHQRNYGVSLSLFDV
jgi:hypothetical protein